MRKRPEDDVESWRPVAEALASNLRRRREALAMSQEDVASRAGLSRFRYQRYEKGEGRPGEPVNPKLRTLVAIAQALRTTVAELLPEELPDFTAR